MVTGQGGTCCPMTKYEPPSLDEIVVKVYPQTFEKVLLSFLLVKNEMDREDIKHHITMLITQGQLHLSPIGPHPQKILDIGTGTGEHLEYDSIIQTSDCF